MDLPVTAVRLSQRITSLDGLRASLAMLIAAYHLGAPGTQFAICALPTFYALSGSLITSLLLAERRRSGSIALGRFVLSRLLRIAPPVVVLVAVVGLLWPVVGGALDSSDDLGLAVGIALTWTSNIVRACTGLRLGVLDPLWSLSAEEQFYVFWPLLVTIALARRSGRRWLVGVLLTVIVVGPLLCLPFFEPSPDAGPALVYYAPPVSMSSLASGCLAALVLDHLRTADRWRARTGSVLTWVGLGLLVAIALAMPTDWKSDPVVILAMLPAAGAASAVFITGLGTSTTIVGRVLSTPPLAWYGARASYSLYIWHLTVAAVLLPRLDGVAGRAVVLVAAIVFGAVAGVLVEQPADRFRRAVLRRLPRRREARRHGV